jgi:hypothetical protein
MNLEEGETPLSARRKRIVGNSSGIAAEALRLDTS